MHFMLIILHWVLDYVWVGITPVYFLASDCFSVGAVLWRTLPDTRSELHRRLLMYYDLNMLDGVGNGSAQGARPVAEIAITRVKGRN